MRKFIYIALIILVNGLYAQQDPMYTQYMFNGLLYNPAYAGSHQDMSFTLQNRFQWLKMEGAPSTFVMTAHTLLEDQFNGVGAVLFRDQIGATVQTGLKGVFSHKILLAKKDASLTLGVQGGLVNYRTNFQDLLIKDENDLVFESSLSKILPNFGGGMLYAGKGYYLTFSIPRIVNNKLVAKSTGTESKESTHFYMGGGFSFPLSKGYVLKPNALVRVVAGAPIQADMNLNFEMCAKYWVGVSYRVGESVDLLFESKIMDKLRIGYSYDLSVNQLKAYVGSSHEIMINYRMGSNQTKGKQRPYNPRYFGA